VRLLRVEEPKTRLLSLVLLATKAAVSSLALASSLIVGAAAGGAAVGRLANVGQAQRFNDAEAAVRDVSAVVKPQPHGCLLSHPERGERQGLVD
jgi:hypothetical protein